MGVQPIDGLTISLDGRYDIVRLVGSGGMADVYLAQDLRHTRPVAIKVLRADVGRSVGRDRFLREIEIAAALQHPNILPIYDSGDAGGWLYYVMPFVDGDTLRARLRRDGPIPWPHTLAIVREVADALGYAHQRNVVHRDIKPENILFLAGHAVVADFGIARAMVESHTSTLTSKLTGDGVGLGTPEYMSPEQAFGESNLDATTDVYSLGCVVYEMLTGVPPFAGATAYAVIARKTTQHPPAPVVPDRVGMPLHVPHALASALARERESRYATVADMLAGLVAEADAPADAPAGATAARTPADSSAAGSIAVLPFANLSGDPSNEFLSDGISDELIHVLARVGGLRVVARTSSFAFKGQGTDARTIGSHLNVGTVLEGSVRRAGNRLRITTQLIDTATGFERWSERYEREFTDVFDVQDDIVRAIVESLKGQFTPASVVPPRVYHTAGGAYEQYLQGRYHWNRRTQTALDASVDCLVRATELDPQFAPAFAALATARVTRAVYGGVQPSPEMQGALAAAERALALRPDFCDAIAARGAVYALHDCNWPAAEQDFENAAAMPQASSTTFQWFAMHVLVPRRRFAEARRQLAQARDVDPLSPVVGTSFGIASYYERDYARSRAELAQVLKQEPRFGLAHYFEGLVHVETGQHDRAIESLARAAASFGESHETTAAIAVAHARAGRAAEARIALADLDRRAQTGFVSPALGAQIHAALGETDDALGKLEHTRAQHSPDLVWIGVRPVYDCLKTSPRFARLLADTNLANA